jgi:hypothetical protein
MSQEESQEDHRKRYWGYLNLCSGRRARAYLDRMDPHYYTKGRSLGSNIPVSPRYPKVAHLPPPPPGSRISQVHTAEKQQNAPQRENSQLVRRSDMVWSAAEAEAPLPVPTPEMVAREHHRRTKQVSPRPSTQMATWIWPTRRSAPNGGPRAGDQMMPRRENVDRRVAIRR